MMGPDATISWSHGTATVARAAAMLTDAVFSTERGPVRPFASAPWRPDDAEIETLPLHLRVLGGDFPCLPFGSAEVPVDAPEDWRRADIRPNDPAHGLPADSEWEVIALDRGSVTLALDLPEPSPVARIERTVAGVDGEAALRFELTVIPRHDHSSSVGLHPIFTLPRPGTGMRLELRFEEGHVYPGSVEGGSGVLRHGARFSSLEAVPAATGTVDLHRLPFAATAEEVVQLTGARSPARLEYDEGHTVELEWDADLLPSVLLWISDGHLTAPPWNGRYRGIGVEPIASAFDFPSARSVLPNPLSSGGAVTRLSFSAGHPVTLRHRITVFGRT